MKMIKKCLIITLLLAVFSSNVFAANMVFLFEGQAESAYREFNDCVQPCDMPVLLDPDSPTNEVDFRTQTNVSFQMIFSVN